MEDEESDDEENSSARNGRGKIPSFSILLSIFFSGVELHTNEYASRHEENRLTATTKDHNIKRKLEVIPSLIDKKNQLHSLAQFTFTLTLVFFLSFIQALKDELGTVQNSNKVTDNDRLHQQNVASGRDKYKTLKMIRQGNTKKRIDEFESM